MARKTTRPFRVVIAMVLLVTTSGLAADVADPVQTHFQAYGTALQANDLEQADVALQSALAASVARDGDGGWTAELSLELARLLLLRRDYAAALEPARRAVRIVDQRGIASGIDQGVARLTLARAELWAGKQRGSDQSLLDLLAELPYSPEAAPDLLAAAHDLAQASDAAGRWAVARQAWAMYGKLLQRRPKPDSLLIASAQVGEARAGTLAMVQQAQTRSRLAQKAGSPDDKPYVAYASMLSEAADRVEPEARKWIAEFEPTLAQRIFAEAEAWRGVLRSKFVSADLELVGALRDTGGGLVLAPPADVPLCAVRLTTEPKAKFPKAAVPLGGIGAVVLKMRFDDAGRVQQFAVVTSAGGLEFEQSVTAVVPGWRLERSDAGAAATCRMARDYLMNVIYLYS